MEVTHCGGTHTIRGGRSKYSIRVLAGADDNLGPNLRQLSASVAWHPVLWWGFSYSSIAPYLSLFFASDSPYRGCMQWEDVTSQYPSVSQSVSNTHDYVLSSPDCMCVAVEEFKVGELICFATGHVKYKLSEYLTLKHS